MTLIEQLFLSEWENLFDCSALDFCISSTHDIPIEVDQSKCNVLQPFGFAGSGSTITLVNRWYDKTAESTSVVWIDSEGSPVVKFASSIREFMTTIPYGTGFIYDVIAAVERFNRSSLYPNPIVKYDKLYVEEQSKRQIDTDPCVEEFLKTLEKEFRIKPSTNPSLSIAQAINENQEFNNWLLTPDKSKI
jgi:hypothetical protein